MLIVISAPDILLLYKFSLIIIDIFFIIDEISLSTVSGFVWVFL